MTHDTHLGSTSFVSRLTTIGYGASAIGIAASLMAAFSDYDRFIFNYLVAFAFFAGIGITAVFFSALQFLTRSGWSAAMRRIPELMGGFVPVTVLLFIPIAMSTGQLYHHWVHPEAGDVVLAGKAAWLNVPFFLVRLAVYALVWVGLYYFIVGNSFRQDAASDHRPTKRNWTFSAPAVILYGVTITFAAFDLLMSLYPHWFSTIFGVYYFSSSLVGTVAVMTIVAVLLKKNGLLTHWLTSDRFHDLGKLLFAFNVFWAYIAFSQYLLIWYANLPEEIVFFTYRTQHGWEYVSIALIVVHFLVPFWLLLSQSAKKNLNVLMGGAVILLVAHFIDMFWLVMPNYAHDHVPVGWIEIAPMIAVGGIFLVVLGMQFKRRSAVPVNDPFLTEAVH